jgi:hypothetical protein
MEMGAPRDFMAVNSGTRSGLVSDVEALTLSSCIIDVSCESEATALDMLDPRRYP